MWAREALRDSWEAVSWVRFDIAADCDDGGIPIEIKDQRPGASGIGTGTPSIIINFDYKNYNFFNLDCDGADNQQCISEQIVHEVGHMIGLGHTHEHDQWVQCGDGRVPSGGGGKGDLSIFEIDTTSVMSYCQERADDRALLSPNDILQIQKLYGGWDAPVTHGDNFALHRDDLKFVRMSSGNTGHPLHVRTPNPSSIIQEADGTRNLMTIRKREGSGRIHYGDQVSLQDVRTGEYYCFVDFGSMGMGVVGNTSECFWDILRPGEVGGSEIHVNDPISIRWPTRVGGNWQWLDRRQLRLLGDFRPEGQP